MNADTCMHLLMDDYFDDLSLVILFSLSSVLVEGTEVMSLSMYMILPPSIIQINMG
uniref:Uncharacterized protein n=1 Tax=Aegilops tauschii subsp. strangulata TaxID=200361 RepID=A0A452ZEP8_AEGTS